MNFFRKTLIVLALIIMLIYVCNITLLPDSIILAQGEMLDLKAMYGITIEKKKEGHGSIQASSNINKNTVNDVGKLDINFNLFGKVPVKEMTINVIPNTKVIPMGKAIGMKLYTDGVLVVGMTEINGKRPYENCGIHEGDRIVEINKNKIGDTNELIETVNKSNGKVLEIKYESDEGIKTTNIEPVKNGDNEYKLGLWVRDATAGVGTMTFYEPSTGAFAALGHGITDIDTRQLITISNGELVTTNIVSIVKGEKGKPGEIIGTIDNCLNLGEVNKNTEYGVYGNISSSSRINAQNESLGEMDVALRKEIKTGKAEILCELENGKREKYEIEIQKIYMNNNENNKSMIVKITDKKLIDKTGGIIQGMSGAPIIQNGKFIGAITHVMVNDPTTGYAVFGDLMVEQMKEMNNSIK